MGKINTYAINLARRTDRKASLISEFKGRNEFQLTVVPAIAHKVGAIGLWQTICQIIQKVCNDDIDNILICEDDHVFTEAYTSNRLIRAINQSRKYDADILLGGVSWFDQVLQVDKNLFWVDRFTGTQFMLIYRKFYEKILEADLGKGGQTGRFLPSRTGFL
ncbi:glycosyl transferase [Anseongella ginsenosidimutans]|uniref:glycosyl transferase n=1 Tax=Anseongella ginsenosidimutans TaxID=496056 RepID=UPI0011CB67D8|nr:glycosyl transferase [Anseongella ginsenosidimutans]QEC51475.1 glycosyl transferase [Anseongella ginsenosidimutans]